MQFWDNIFSPRGKKYVDEDEVLTKSNTTEYSPTTDYNPATKKYVDDKMLQQDETPIEFTEAEQRVNINSGETLSTLFGKIKKWFTDLKAIAFTGSWDDLQDIPQQLLVSDDPTIPAEDAKLNADTLDGHSAEYFATQTDLNGVNTTINQVLQNISTIENSVTDIEGDIVTIDQNIDNIESSISDIEGTLNDTFGTSGVLPISKGGTGNTTADNAFKALATNFGYGQARSLGAEDFNNIIQNGFYSVVYSSGTNQSTYNTPRPNDTNTAWYNIIVIGPTNRVAQIAIFGYRGMSASGRMWMRYRHDTTWTDWYELITDNNIDEYVGDAITDGDFIVPISKGGTGSSTGYPSTVTFANRSLNTVNCDTTYNYNYTVAYSSHTVSTYGTHPITSGWCQISNFYSVHFAYQVASSISNSTSANRTQRMWTRERYTQGSTAVWSEWHEIGYKEIDDDSTTAKYVLGVDNGLLYIEQTE